MPGPQNADLASGSYYNSTLKPKLPASAQDAAAAANSVTAPSGNNTTSANPYDTSNLPFQGIYNEDQAAANKAYQDALTGLQQQRGGYNLQYGFNDQGTEDPNNPMGLFQLQRGAEAHQLDDARNAAVGRGIGTIGLGAQDEGYLHTQQDAADNQLLGTYKGLLNQNDQGKLSAANSLQAALLQARRNQIQQAIDAGYFTPQTITGGGETAPAAASSSNSPNTAKADKTPDALARYLANQPKVAKAATKPAVSIMKFK